MAIEVLKGMKRVKDKQQKIKSNYVMWKKEKEAFTRFNYFAQWMELASQHN